MFVIEIIDVMRALKHHFKKQQKQGFWGGVCYNKVTIGKGSENEENHNNDNFGVVVIWVVGAELGK